MVMLAGILLQSTTVAKPHPVQSFMIVICSTRGAYSISIALEESRKLE